MTESDLHKTIKRKVSEGLEELGYETKMEARVKKGRVDVLAVKDGKELKVEIANTHIPEWVLVEMKQKPNVRRFMQSLNDDMGKILKRVAATKNITLQKFIRTVIIPEWAEANKVKLD